MGCFSQSTSQNKNFCDMISLKSWRPDLNPSHNQHTIVQTGLEERTWNASKYFKKFCSGLYELSNLYLTQDLRILLKILRNPDDTYLIQEVSVAF